MISLETPQLATAQLTVDVRDCGAIGDGQTDDTRALQHAIDACRKAGGGRVVLSDGTFVAGSLRLCSNLELHVDKSAVLLGAPDKDRYSGPNDGPARKKRWLHAFLWGEDLENVSFTGSGVIDGNNVFDPDGEEKQRGPHLILLRRCRNVVLRDLTLQGAANYAFLFYACRDVRVLDAQFLGGWDGIHFRNIGDAWNHDLTVNGCTFMTGDDAIAGACIEDATIENCLLNSACNGLRLIGPARRFTLRHCRFQGPGVYPHRLKNRFNMLAGILVQPGAWEPWPGPVEELRFHDLDMREVSCAFQVALTLPSNSARDIVFERIRATLSGPTQAATSVESWTDEPLRDIVCRDISIEASGGETARDWPIEAPKHGTRALPVWGFYARNVQGLALSRVDLQAREGDAREPLLLEDVTDLRRENGLPLAPHCEVEAPPSIPRR